MHLTPHNLSIEAMAKRDADDASHGHAVSNPYPVSDERHDLWQMAFEMRLAELSTFETN